MSDDELKYMILEANKKNKLLKDKRKFFYNFNYFLEKVMSLNLNLKKFL